MWAPAVAALALKFGMDALRKALVDHMASRNEFFPQPSTLRARIEDKAHSDGMRRSALKHMREQAEAKAIWERERSEEKREKEEAKSSCDATKPPRGDGWMREQMQVA